MLVTASQQTKGPLESKTYKLVGLSVARLRTSSTLPLAAAFNRTHRSRHSLWINTAFVLRAICKAGLTFRWAVSKTCSSSKGRHSTEEALNNIKSAVIPRIFYYAFPPEKNTAIEKAIPNTGKAFKGKKFNMTHLGFLAHHPWLLSNKRGNKQKA